MESRSEDEKALLLTPRTTTKRAGTTSRNLDDESPDHSKDYRLDGLESGGDDGEGHEGSESPIKSDAHTNAAAAPLAAAMWFPFYLVCSVGMVLLNKNLSMHFRYPNTVLGLQNGASVVYLWLGGRASIGLFDLSVPFRPAQFRPFLFPTINWVIMLVLSLKMLQYNSVATMTMFKTLGTLITCTIDITYFGVAYSSRAKASLGLLAIGSAVYAGSDVGFSATGYFYATLQISSWVLQTFIEKAATVDSVQTKAGVAVIRNLLSVPVVVLLIGLSGETDAIGELAGRREIWGEVLLSSLFGCGLGLGTSALYKYFAPTTVVVSNNVGKCISIILGCILFKDTLSILQVFGLGLSLSGSFFYGQEEKKRLEDTKKNISQ